MQWVYLDTAFVHASSRTMMPLDLEVSEMGS